MNPNLSNNDSITCINKKIVAYKSKPSSFICSDYGSISINSNKDLISFGDNTSGCIGHDIIDSIKNPPTQIPNLHQIVMVDCGTYHTVCIDFSGTLFTFGRNDEGQLGIGKDYDSFDCTQIPQKIMDIPPIDAISCGNNFTVCISIDRILYSFGQNNYGQLGLGNNHSYLSPQLIPDLNNIEFIQCSGNYTISKSYSNAYYSWGNNEFGQLGQGNNQKSCNKPVKCLNWPPDIIDVKCGSYHTIALTSTGYIYSFGDNTYGILGVNNENNIIVNIPTLIKDIPLITRIECGFSHSMCIDINNNLWVFGYNCFGQLGLGDTKNRYKPILHESLHDIVDISSRGDYTFVKTIDNKIYGFGINEAEQLGIETKEKFQTKPIQLFKEKEDIWGTNIYKSKQKSARK